MPDSRARRGLACLGLALGIGALACAGPDALRVDLSRRTELPRVRSLLQADASSSSSPLRIAVTGLLTPAETLTGYAALLAYLENGLGRPVRLVQRGTYAELNALMQAGELDMALVCPFPYVQGHRAFGMELLAAVVHRREAVHYSYLVVAADSGMTTLQHLRGKRFAFSDPNSHSGWLVPAYQLALVGTSPGQFFGRSVFTYHHSESLRAVAEHVVDGAAVDSLIYDYVSTIDPQIVARTRVIARWGPYPSPPFVVRPDLDPSVKEGLRQLLLGLAGNPEGREILEQLQLDGFAVLDDRDYDVVREMEARAGAAIAGRR